MHVHAHVHVYVVVIVVYIKGDTASSTVYPSTSVISNNWQCTYLYTNMYCHVHVHVYITPPVGLTLSTTWGVCFSNILVYTYNVV